MRAGMGHTIYQTRPDQIAGRYMQDTPFSVVATSRTPKYQQIIDGVLQAISAKELNRGDALPSISRLCQEFSLARETVLRAYGELKNRGIITAEPRKGYFVASESIGHTVRVFLLFDEFSPYKEVLYNALMEELAGKAVVDIYFHHYAPKMFERLILDNLNQYGIYVVMAFPHKNTMKVLKQIKPESLLLIDRMDGPWGACSHVGQDHDEALYDCLTEAQPLLSKYEKVSLVFPNASNHPVTIPAAFRRFGENHAMSHAVISDISQCRIKKKEAYYTIDDADLVHIVEECRAKGYVLGRDVGVLSYNDTPMKHIAGDGITVISTDFAQLGVRAAQHILDPALVQEINPTQLIVRNSL